MRKFIISSKVPRDYERRVLQRIFPYTAEQIAKFSKEQLASLARGRDEISKMVKADPVRFFQPNAGDQERYMRFLDTEENRKKVGLIFVAGNKAGKTTATAILSHERQLGRAIWDRENRKKVSWPVPSIGMYYTEDFETHNETILPNLKSWCPPGEIQAIRRNNQQQPIEFVYNNGSIIRFKTYAQGIDTAEGKDWDWVAFDEPPPRDLYTAVFRGLVATGGKLVIAATLVKEAWIYDEGDHDHIERFVADIHSNLWLSEETKAAFLATLSPEEREVRELGKPANIVGVVYKSFRDAPPFVVPVHHLPYECPYIMGVDPHERRPTHVAYGYVTPQDEIVWFEWALVTGPLKQMFAELREIESTFPRPIRLCIMDPNRGKARQIDNNSWEDSFLDAGYDVVLGNDNINIGHTEMYNYLTINPLTNRPAMMWTEKCRGHKGPVYMMTRYSWEDWAPGSRMEKDKKEKPKQLNKDFPDIFRYTAMEGLRYDSLYHGYQTHSSLQKGFRAYGRVA